MTENALDQASIPAPNEKSTDAAINLAAVLYGSLMATGVNSFFDESFLFSTFLSSAAILICVVFLVRSLAVPLLKRELASVVPDVEIASVRRFVLRDYTLFFVSFTAFRIIDHLVMHRLHAPIAGFENFTIVIFLSLFISRLIRPLLPMSLFNRIADWAADPRR